jgi:hypothetical protein
MKIPRKCDSLQTEALDNWHLREHMAELDDMSRALRTTLLDGATEELRAARLSQHAGLAARSKQDAHGV